MWLLWRQGIFLLEGDSTLYIVQDDKIILLLFTNLGSVFDLHGGTFVIDLLNHVLVKFERIIILKVSCVIDVSLHLMLFGL